jgi:AcrR family transcriptional regulator
MTLGTTRGKKAAATRKSLLHAALEVMSRKGYTAATIDEIAKEAGVSKGLAYYHFKNKGEIATEILTNGINELIDTFESIGADAQSAAEALEGMLNAFCDKIVGNLRFGRFYLLAMWRGGRVWSDDMHDIEMRLIEVIAAQFKRAQEEGLVREDIDAEFAAVSCVGLVLTSAMRYFGDDDADEPKITKEQFTNEIVNFVANATAVHA